MSPVLTMGGAPKLTKRQWMTMVAIGSVHFSSAICISLQAPFYPQEAELKGATATEYGLVFGSFELIAFLSSPILGKYLDSWGAKTTLHLGMILAALSAILFGMLDYVMAHNWFISLSFLLRITEALGSTAALVAAFSITAAVFPKSIGTTFATLEVFYGVGYIVGPTIGGFLFSLGGFKLPFIVNGLAMLVIALVIVYVLPPIYQEVKDEQGDGITDFLKVPAILLNSAAVVATAISMGFYSATLEPHLRLFNLSPIAMGLMFVISGGTYACVAPIVGRICDRWAYPKRVISVGCVLVVISFTIVGPAPFVPLPTTLPLCIIGLVIHGVGLASLMVPTFMDSICSAVAAGFNDDIGTYGILSGLWSASFSLGAFIGPSVAGVLYDKVGFRNGTLFVIIIHSALFVVCTCFITFEKKRSLPPNRVRLLSERYETEDDTSDFEHVQTLNKGNIPTNALLGWDLARSKSNSSSGGIPSVHNGYGSFTHPY
ncbi:MFS-type transporter SLC18B1-like isoform X2 [Macrosteles quadrilineatus]|nr:MFS-type transporter SLC18B1-like isoform X2 [Macrosteles quadrilineatus]XP_054273155.1 MFS-type transporter SLC18B1-like isoform X2 [Macrosteles quadrilineatus]XP_054273156.1 MFS-type transporter SLC18B1-like isoform X2 [Macrosteles quadrilineatus]